MRLHPYVSELLPHPVAVWYRCVPAAAGVRVNTKATGGETQGFSSSFLLSRAKRCLQSASGRVRDEK